MTKFALRAVSRRLGATLVAAYMATPVAAAQLTLAGVPLFLGGLVQPNIMLTLDDSSSMALSYMPDSIGYPYTPNLDGTKRGLAAERNSLAYSPAVIYEPALLGAGGVNLTTFSAALNDGFDASAGTTALGSDYWPSWQSDRDYAPPKALGTGVPAFYYVFYANHPSVPQSLPANCDITGPDAGLDDDDCYVQVTVSSSSGAGLTDERQNFANWYSFYRKRMYAVKSAARIALEQLGESTRIGVGRLGVSTTVVNGIDIFTGSHRTTVLNTLGNIKACTPASPATSCDTPLRRAADDVGRYFTGAAPWRNSPTNSGSTSLSCRRSYHLLMSDGYWNGASAAGVLGFGARADNDDPPSSVGDGAVVSPSTTPGDTLADVAAYYWKTDLDGNPANDNVPTSAFDPAAHQHLQTIALGVGLEPTRVDDQKAFAHLTDPTIVLSPSWPTVIYPNGPDTLDDFLHAAVNSRGAFVDVSVPADLAGILSQIVSSIPGSGASSASVVLNSGALRSDTRLYQARFDSGDWSGELLAYEIVVDPTNPARDGQVGSLIWDAGQKLTSQATASWTNRFVATYRLATKKQGSKYVLEQNSPAPAPVAFDWTTISAEQQANLTAISANGPDLVKYLRGDRANESPNGKQWRKRSSLLGDIVNAAPAYLGPPSALYPDVWMDADVSNPNATAAEDGYPYSTFRSVNSTRKGLLLAGANDGMLHAFEAAVWNSSANKWVDGSGKEVFAYVPGSVLLRTDKRATTGSTLADVANTNYGSSPPHRYFVDGSPTVGDAFFGTAKAWRSVVVSGLGGGGQAVFALDVTSPSAVADLDVVKKVLWEYTDLDDPDLGNTFSQPNIIRILDNKKGRWVALFGNGFNSDFPDGAASSGEGKLIALNIEDGKFVNAWFTNSTSRGLATAVPIDTNGDFTADYAYAGDLDGNLWRFDLSSFNSKGTLIYQALDANGNPQPITTRPSVARHPEHSGVLVYFGTGKYLETTDASASNQNTQTFYAIWDQDPAKSGQVPSATRPSGGNPNPNSSLLQQSILEEVTGADGLSYRVTTDNLIDWKVSSTQGQHLGWFMDLLNTQSNNPNNYGERQVSDSIVRGGKAIFTTLIPDADACAFGGGGWLMELDAASGGHPKYAVFDINKNGVFDLGDFVAVTSQSGSTVAPSGRRNPAVGIVPMPAILSRAGGEKEFKYMSGSSGTVDVVAENPGAQADFLRESWQQHGVLE